MFAQNQNYYSPVGSPIKRSENSPIVSPMKGPRPQSSYTSGFGGVAYKPPLREEILG